tara:strand:- start:19922 stop:20116 length:195 start_codon:yes stop_codon:yes gene_type:complete
MNIKKSIRVCLAVKGMTMPELAEKLEVSITRVYRLADNPTALTINRIAGAFGMKASEFLALGEE